MFDAGAVKYAQQVSQESAAYRSAENRRLARAMGVALAHSPYFGPDFCVNQLPLRSLSNFLDALLRP